MKKIENRTANSYTILCDNTGKMVLSSSVVNIKSFVKQNVLMLSTIQLVLETSKVDARKKPAIYKVYDYLKGDADMVDQRTKFYQSWMYRDVSRSRDTSRDTFLSVSVSPRFRYANVSSRSRTLKVSENGHVSIETRKNFGFETAFRSSIRKQQWYLPNVFKVKHCK